MAYECSKLEKLCIPHGIGKPGGYLHGEYVLHKEFAVCSYCEHRSPISDSVFERVNGKLNVGFVPCVYNEFGGVERWHETLLPNLPNDAIHVVGLASHSEFTGTPAILKCPIRSGEESVKALLEACDVVICWGMVKLPEVDRKPVLINVQHGQFDHEWSNNIAAEADKWVDQHVTVHSPFQPAGTTKPATHIPNAFDRDQLAADPYWRMPAELAGKRLCVWQHRLAPEKNPAILPAIAEALQKLDADWRIVVVGDGGERAAVDHPLIHYAGTSAWPGRWLSVASCFLSTAEHEGFGLACLEAMAYGVPVVSTATGICADAALCVQVGFDATPEEWAAAIVGAKRDSDTVFGIVSKRYSLEKHVEAWRKLITSVAGRPEVTRQA